MKNISFHDASMKFGTAPDWGINGKAAIHALKVDTLQLDTVFFTVKQDTTRMNLRAGVINGPKNPQFSFSTILTGEIRDRDAELLAEYKNEKGETGVLLESMPVRWLEDVEKGWTGLYTDSGRTDYCVP